MLYSIRILTGHITTSVLSYLFSIIQNQFIIKGIYNIKLYIPFIILAKIIYNCGELWCNI